MKKYYTEFSNQPLVAQLQQLTSLTWDGDLIDKNSKKILFEKELITCHNGWSVINKRGIDYLETLGFIAP